MLEYVRRHWVAAVLIFAVAFGLYLNWQAVERAEETQRAAQREQATFNVGACERGNKLRLLISQQVKAGGALRDVVLANVTIAAETDPSPAARVRWRAQQAELAGVQFRSLPQVDCEKLVESQTPVR